MGNLLAFLLKAVTLLPTIVVGIEQIHKEASGATKKQMAMDALGLASGTASVLAPASDQAAISATSQFASDTIDGLVNVFNATGLFQSKSAAALPPAPTVPALVTLPPVSGIASVPQVAAADPAAAAPAAPKVGD
jgi:hypothetical protein